MIYDKNKNENKDVYVILFQELRQV